jgi:hypothetical protein
LPFVVAGRCRDWPFCGLAADQYRVRRRPLTLSRHGFRSPPGSACRLGRTRRKGAPRPSGMGLRPTLPPPRRSRIEARYGERVGVWNRHTPHNGPLRTPGAGPGSRGWALRQIRSPASHLAVERGARLQGRAHRKCRPKRSFAWLSSPSPPNAMSPTLGASSGRRRHASQVAATTATTPPVADHRLEHQPAQPGGHPGGQRDLVGDLDQRPPRPLVLGAGKPAPEQHHLGPGRRSDTSVSRCHTRWRSR